MDPRKSQTFTATPAKPGELLKLFSVGTLLAAFGSIVLCVSAIVPVGECRRFGGDSADWALAALGIAMLAVGGALVGKGIS